MMRNRNIVSFARAWMGLAYVLEAIRIKLSKKWKDLDPIQSLYESYIEQVIGKEICPQGGYQNYQIFLSFRDKTLGKLTERQEKLLMKMLEGRIAKWFVPYVLNVTDIFSVELLDKIIDAAIEMEEPEHISFFLNPAKRVFDLKVNLELHDRFHRAANRNKNRILGAIDRVGSRKVSKVTVDGYVENYGTKYVWSGTKFRNTARMKDADFSEYCHSVKFIDSNRLEVLLAEYLTTTSVGIRNAIACYLPKEINEFPLDLLEPAKKCIKMMNNSLVRTD